MPRTHTHTHAHTHTHTHTHKHTHTHTHTHTHKHTHTRTHTHSHTHAHTHTHTHSHTHLTMQVDLEEAPKGRGHRDRAYGFSVTRRLDDLSDGSEDEMQSSSLGGVFNSQPKKGPNTATYSAALIDVGNFYSHIWKVLCTRILYVHTYIQQMHGTTSLQHVYINSCGDSAVQIEFVSSFSPPLPFHVVPSPLPHFAFDSCPSPSPPLRVC